MRFLISTLSPFSIALSLFCAVNFLTEPAPAQDSQHAFAHAEASEGIVWRRTVDGWERADLWAINQAALPVQTPASQPLHPLVVAMLQVVISIGALWAYPPLRKGWRNRRARFVLR